MQTLKRAAKFWVILAVESRGIVPVLPRQLVCHRPFRQYSSL